MFEDKLKYGDYFPPYFIVCEKNVLQAFSTKITLNTSPMT